LEVSVKPSLPQTSGAAHRAGYDRGRDADDARYLPCRPVGQWVARRGNPRRAGYKLTDHETAIERLQALADELAHSHPGAAASLREGLAETVTLQRLGVHQQLWKSLSSTNPIESMIGICRAFDEPDRVDDRHLPRDVAQRPPRPSRPLRSQPLTLITGSPPRSSTANGTTSSAAFDIELSQPTYPRPGASILRLPLVAGEQNRTRVLSAPAVDHEIQTERRRIQIAKLPVPERDIRLAILNQVVARREWPRVFLAYTASSRRHAELVRGSLGEHYDIVMREASECDPQEASSEVSACDFFIGLWHHNKHLIQGLNAFGGSPWIHFQYGLAVAAGKPTLIVRSTDADPTSWPDSLAGPHHIEYTDLGFAKVTLGEIQRFCNDHFRLDAD